MGYIFIHVFKTYQKDREFKHDAISTYGNLIQ